MATTPLMTSSTTMRRAWLAVISGLALLAAVYTYVLLALHISSLRMSPGARLPLVGFREDQEQQTLPAGMHSSYAGLTAEVDVLAYEGDQGFLTWQIAAWAGRYGLAILLLLSVVYLCWRLWRRTPGLGRAMSWWAAGMGLLAAAVAVLAPWALVRADQMVAEEFATPLEPQADGPWFVMPHWSLQDTDWWLVLFAALLLLLAVLLRRAHEAERDTEGLI